MDWNKFIPFCNVGTFRRSLQWPETTSGTLHKLLDLRQPIPNRARWAGQIVVSKKFDGFSKHPHLAKISSTSVWTPENFKNFLWFLISLLHCVSGIIDVEELLRSSAPQIPPTILTNEHDIVFLYFPSNKLWFFWGKCIVYLDKEAIFTFRGKSCLLLAYATTCSLSSVKKLINFGPICMTNRTCFHLFARLYGQCPPHTSTTKIVLNMTYSDSTDLK